MSSLDQIDGVSQWNTILLGHSSPRTQLLHNIDHVFGYAGVRMGRYKLVKGIVVLINHIISNLIGASVVSWLGLINIIFQLNSYSIKQYDFFTNLIKLT